MINSNHDRVEAIDSNSILSIQLTSHIPTFRVMILRQHGICCQVILHKLRLDLYNLKQEHGHSINDLYVRMQLIRGKVSLSEPTWDCTKKVKKYPTLPNQLCLY